MSGVKERLSELSYVNGSTSKDMIRASVDFMCQNGHAGIGLQNIMKRMKVEARAENLGYTTFFDVLMARALGKVPVKKNGLVYVVDIETAREWKSMDERLMRLGTNRETEIELIIDYPVRVECEGEIEKEQIVRLSNLLVADDDHEIIIVPNEVTSMYQIDQHGKIIEYGGRSGNSWLDLMILPVNEFDHSRPPRLYEHSLTGTTLALMADGSVMGWERMAVGICLV